MDSENIGDKLNIDLIKRFSSPLCSRDSSVRELALTNIQKTVDELLNALTCEDTSEGIKIEMEESGDIVVIEKTCVDKLAMLSLYLPAILRLSVNCPFQDVRDKFLEILMHLKVS